MPEECKDTINLVSLFCCCLPPQDTICWVSSHHLDWLGGAVLATNREGGSRRYHRKEVSTNILSRGMTCHLPHYCHSVHMWHIAPLPHLVLGWSLATSAASLCEFPDAARRCIVAATVSPRDFNPWQERAPVLNARKIWNGRGPYEYHWSAVSCLPRKVLLVSRMLVKLHDVWGLKAVAFAALWGWQYLKYLIGCKVL